MDDETKGRIVKLCERIGWPELDGEEMGIETRPDGKLHWHTKFWGLRKSSAEAFFEKRRWLEGKLVEAGCTIVRDKIKTEVRKYEPSDAMTYETISEKADHFKALLDAAEKVLK